LDPARPGIIWFDAHGDFNTPETTSSGSLDGMGLAIATGRCWRKLAGTIPGFSPVPEWNVLHVGARDLDAGEKPLLDASGVAVIDAQRIAAEGVRSSLEPALAALSGRVREVYVHVDIDVLDPREAPANQFSTPGGLAVDQLVEAIELIAERFTISATAITAYDPQYDPD